MAAFFRKASLTKFIFLLYLEVKCSNIVENNAGIAPQHYGCIVKTDLLHQRTLFAVQFTRVPVYFVFLPINTRILVKTGCRL